VFRFGLQWGQISTCFARDQNSTYRSKMAPLFILTWYLSKTAPTLAQAKTAPQMAVMEQRFSFGLRAKMAPIIRKTKTATEKLIWPLVLFWSTTRAKTALLYEGQNGYEKPIWPLVLFWPTTRAKTALLYEDQNGYWKTNLALGSILAHNKGQNSTVIALLYEGQNGF